MSQFNVQLSVGGLCSLHEFPALGPDRTKSSGCLVGAKLECTVGLEKAVPVVNYWASYSSEPCGIMLVTLIKNYSNFYSKLRADGYPEDTEL